MHSLSSAKSPIVQVTRTAQISEVKHILLTSNNNRSMQISTGF